MLAFRRDLSHAQGPGGVAEPPADDLLAEIDELGERNREPRDPAREREILALRHRAGARLAGEATGAGFPEPDFEGLADGPGCPS